MIYNAISSFVHSLFHKCPICYCNCFFKSTTLSCGHVYHTECILSWFRSKKNTCPYCRDTGVQHVIDNQIQLNLDEQVVFDGVWNEHPAVRAFLGNENATKDEIVEAYFIRDTLGFNISIDECFASVVRGMGCDPDGFEKQIINKFISDKQRMFKEFLFDSSGKKGVFSFNVDVNFESFVVQELESDLYKKQLKMYNNLEDARDSGDHRAIYKLIDVANLRALGW